MDICIFSKVDGKIKAWVDAPKNRGVSKIPRFRGKIKEMEKLPVILNLNSCQQTPEKRGECLHWSQDHSTSSISREVLLTFWNDRAEAWGVLSSGLMPAIPKTWDLLFLHSSPSSPLPSSQVYILCYHSAYKDRGEGKKRDYFVFNRR